MTVYSFNHLLGTRDDGTKTARLELLMDGYLQHSFTDNGQIQAFITACLESQNYFQDIAEQTHLHVTPSTAPSVFTNLAEEQAELVQIQHFTKKNW